MRALDGLPMGKKNPAALLFRFVPQLLGCLPYLQACLENPNKRFPSSSTASRHEGDCVEKPKK
jgi:hypothetical protein